MKNYPADNVKSLLDTMAVIVESPENSKRQEKWNRSILKGTYKKDRSPNINSIPCTLFLGPTYWNKKTGMDIGRYYTDPDYYLENYLKNSIDHFIRFDDDSFFTKTIPIQLGVGFESELLGVKVQYLADKDPWVDMSGGRVESMQDIDKLPYFEFFNNTHMKFVHRFYRRIGDSINDYNDFKVGFPDWFRGPFPLALELRGWENLLVDTVENEDLVHSLMKYITGFRIEWCRCREKFTGEHSTMRLGNDEINYPIVSAHIYEKFVLPYEMELFRFGNRISYWHSCGNITQIAEIIGKIPQIDLIQISPFTNLAKIVEIFKERATAFQIWLHPVDDVLFASKEKMRSTLRRIYDDCSEMGVADFCLVSGHIQPMMQLVEQEPKIKEWLHQVRAVFN